MPVIASTHAAAAAIQQRHELEPAIEPFARAARLKAHERVQLPLLALEAPVVLRW